MFRHRHGRSTILRHEARHPPLDVVPLPAESRPERSALPTASPGGGGGDLKGISFIAFRFTCADGTFFAKVENITAGSFDCDGPNKKKDGNCGVDQAGAGDGCGRFSLTGHTFDGEGELVAVTVVLTCPGAAFVAGASNCGPTGCVPASGSGGSATFVGCA